MPFHEHVDAFQDIHPDEPLNKRIGRVLQRLRRYFSGPHVSIVEQIIFHLLEYESQFICCVDGGSHRDGQWQLVEGDQAGYLAQIPSVKFVQ